jgi:hypothetical protein
MHIALTLQDHFISEVERSLVGSAERTSPGHIETPAEPFWEQCRAALLSAAGALPFNTEPSLGLVIEHGLFRRPATWSAFGDAIMTGTALPAILIELGSQRYPLSLRNVLGVVVDHWATRNASNTSNVDLTAPIAAFLQQRLAAKDGQNQDPSEEPEPGERADASSLE